MDVARARRARERRRREARQRNRAELRQMQELGLRPAEIEDDAVEEAREARAAQRQRQRERNLARVDQCVRQSYEEALRRLRRIEEQIEPLNRGALLPLQSPLRMICAIC